MSSETVLYIIIGILSFDFILDQLLDYMNLKHQKATLPDSLKDIYDEEKYEKAQDYYKTNARFDLITSTFSFILVLVLFSSGALGWLDGLLRIYFENSIVLALSFFAVLFIVSELLNLPFSIYRIFVIEERFGFNKMTAKTYVTDKLKGYLIAFILGGILLSLFLYLILNIGSNFWFWFWLTIVVFMLLMNMFYTSLILPLYNKLTPLPDGELRRQIQEYAKSVHFPVQNLFVIDGSKRSSKSNAFFSGIGKKKKIVLFDTLIENHTEEELVAVLAHEVGHFKKKHVISGMVLSIVQMGLMLFILSLFVFNPTLSRALGSETMSIHLNLIAFAVLYTPISHITGIFMNIFSRKNEYEADRYAAETYKAEPLKDALKKLSINNLSNLTPHPAYVFVHYSHPPLVQRLEHLNKFKK
ncbi:MAG: M48 family metallopeptidase [Cytophagaceae bacterium]